MRPSHATAVERRAGGRATGRVTRERNLRTDAAARPFERRNGHRYGTVIVAEDDDAARDYLGEVLGLAGVPTIAVASGAEALVEARRERPALVILDVCL